MHKRIQYQLVVTTHPTTLSVNAAVFVAAIDDGEASATVELMTMHHLLNKKRLHELKMNTANEIKKTHNRLRMLLFVSMLKFFQEINRGTG
jgi:hypothetical protein